MLKLTSATEVMLGRFRGPARMDSRLDEASSSKDMGVLPSSPQRLSTPEQPSTPEGLSIPEAAIAMDPADAAEPDIDPVLPSSPYALGPNERHMVL